MKSNQTLKTIGIIAISLFILYTITPAYLKMTIVHLFPGIEDYKIFKNRIVATGTVSPWQNAHDFMQYKITDQERDTLEHYKSVAYLIIQHDSIVYEEYWDNFNQHTLSNSFSVAKSVVGLLIGCAIDDGYIQSIDQAVGDFIPEFKIPPNNKLTIRHLLTMSSGLNWNESYDNPFSMTTKAYYGNAINKLVLDLKVIETPGKEFHYKSGNTQLLSIILKKATKKSLSDYASEKLWIPLGAENEALWSLDKTNGDEKAYCCLNSNARDFARLGKLILKDGHIKKKQLISKKYLQKSITAANYLTDHEDHKPVDFYGYQWWIINHEGENIPYARGIYGQYIFALKKHDAIVVRLGHKRSKSKINHHPSEIYSYLSTAKRILKQR
ncbi:serine hydrolase [Labilibacter sediminis]|nr:serine hydrolase [Labilibacter sediminis]